MSELFDSLRLKNTNEVELIISGKIVPIIVTDLEEECVSYEMKTKIKLTGIINCRSSAKKITRSIAGMEIVFLIWHIKKLYLMLLQRLLFGRTEVKQL